MGHFRALNFKCESNDVPLESLRLLPEAFARFTFALEVGYKGDITQSFRKRVVKVPSVENISFFILCYNARAKR